MKSTNLSASAVVICVRDFIKFLWLVDLSRLVRAFIFMTDKFFCHVDPLLFPFGLLKVL